MGIEKGEESEGRHIAAAAAAERSIPPPPWNPIQTLSFEFGQPKYCAGGFKLELELFDEMWRERLKENPLHSHCQVLFLTRKNSEVKTSCPVD